MTQQDEELDRVTLPKSVSFAHLGAVCGLVVSSLLWIYKLDSKIDSVAQADANRIATHERAEGETFKIYDERIKSLKESSDVLLTAINRLSDKIDKILERLSSSK